LGLGFGVRVRGLGGHSAPAGACGHVLRGPRVTPVASSSASGTQRQPCSSIPQGSRRLNASRCVGASRSSCCASHDSCAPVSSTWASGSGGGDGTAATADEASSCRARAAAARCRKVAAASASPSSRSPRPPPPTTRVAASSVRRLLCVCATPPPGMPAAARYVLSRASGFSCRRSRYASPRRSLASDDVSVTAPANQRFGSAVAR